ncbi:MAG: AI-2E family transporter [Oceanospirillaceae bacterium]|nr:AI-2E family transporter [Oceanospirillaceae bacterium]
MTQSQTWLLFIVGLIVSGLIYLLQPVLTPFVVGIFIAYLADPFADRLEIRGFSRTIATVIVFVVLILVLVAMVIIIVPLLVKQLQALVNVLPHVELWYNTTLIPWLQASLGLDLTAINLQLVTQKLASQWQQTGGAVSQMVKYVTRSSVNLLSTLGSIAMVPVVAFYMLRDFDLVLAKIKALLPINVQPRVSAFAVESNEVLAAFVRGQLLVMFGLGVIYALGLSFVGLDYALLIGVLAGLASVVPYLGFIVGIAVAMAIGFFQFDSWLPLSLILVVFGIGQLIESFVLTPLFVGDRIGLHPVAVIFAILAGGQLFGFMGILLALPISAVVMVLLRNVYAGYISSPLYGRQDSE